MLHLWASCGEMRALPGQTLSWHFTRVLRDWVEQGFYLLINDLGGLLLVATWALQRARVSLVWVSGWIWFPLVAAIDTWAMELWEELGIMCEYVAARFGFVGLREASGF